jgi:hypothetical protein
MATPANDPRLTMAGRREISRALASSPSFFRCAALAALATLATACRDRADRTALFDGPREF